MRFFFSGEVAVIATYHGKSSLQGQHLRGSNDDIPENRRKKTKELRGKSQDHCTTIRIEKDLRRRGSYGQKRTWPWKVIMQRTARYTYATCSRHTLIPAGI